MNNQSNYRDLSLRTRMPPGEMWHAYVQELLDRIERSTGGLISSENQEYERRRVA